MAFECPRRSSPPSPMFDADTGCIATDPAPSARRRFPQQDGHRKTFRPTNTPKKLRTRRLRHEPRVEFSQGARVVDPAFGMGCRVSPSQHIDITRAKWIPYCWISSTRGSVRKNHMTQRLSEPPPAKVVSADRVEDPVGVWLIEEGWRVSGVAEVVRGLCEGFVASGLPMWRLNLFVRTLHPEVMGASYLWRRGESEVGVFEAGHEVLESDAYLQSPSRVVFERSENATPPPGRAQSENRLHHSRGNTRRRRKPITFACRLNLRSLDARARSR